MGIFDLFSKKVIAHPKYGELQYGFGTWKGHNAKLFGEQAVEIRIPGDKSGPSATSIEELKKLEDRYQAIKAELATTLYQEHYINGKDAYESGELVELMEEYPTIESPEDIWDFASLVRVWVQPYGNKGQIELAYGTEWDIEHTLGFTLEGGNVVEFSGSVGP